MQDTSDDEMLARGCRSRELLVAALSRCSMSRRFGMSVSLGMCMVLLMSVGSTFPREERHFSGISEQFLGRTEAASPRALKAQGDEAATDASGAVPLQAPAATLEEGPALVAAAARPQEAGATPPTTTRPSLASAPTTRPSNDDDEAGAPMRRKKPFLQVHIHKAAGTFLCAMAGMVGETVVQPSSNCNLVGNDGYQDSGTQTRMSCAARSSLFVQAGFTYGQIEHELWPADLCFEEFEYGTVLREPIDLMHSVINYNKLYHNGASKSELLTELNDLIKTSPPLPTNNSQFASWKAFDNYQIRILANAMDVPAGQIDKEHLERAKQVLSKFAAVGSVSNLKSESTRKAFFIKLGWNATASQNLSAAAKKPVNHVSLGIYNFSRSEEARLRWVNRHDLALYYHYFPAAKPTKAPPSRRRHVLTKQLASGSTARVFKRTA